MILVLSQQAYESTTDVVQDWIEHLGGDAVRLNGEDLTGGEPFAVRLGAAGETLRMRIGGRDLEGAEIGSVWRRRWHQMRGLAPFPGTTPELRQMAQRHLASEITAVSQSVFALVEDAPWLSRPLAVNKVRALRLAHRAGLRIPETLMTNRRDEVLDFIDAHGEVITKCSSDGEMFPDAEDRSWAHYTSVVTREDAERLPETFFPSLLQAQVHKSYELRVFYLDGECWPMAIFSQADAQTAVDFRVYNSEYPNRTVPYRLPAAVDEAVHRFMAAVGLENGSLDLIRTPGGEHVFLEVNPVGQFAMVAEPCNYPLFRRVAEYLIRAEQS
ncbi:MAG TPA: grasp-with-spasm system ATP-grasp peptide maturase [Longimicrobium sp.]|nr:grasp-with-spasm system ATP-grasp peptide maturase [Longimicrobium sp.]